MFSTDTDRKQAKLIHEPDVIVDFRYEEILAHLSSELNLPRTAVFLEKEAKK